MSQRGRVEANAVVFDRDLESPSRLRERDADARGIGVLAHVGERLLEDPQELDLRGGRKLGAGSVAGRDAEIGDAATLLLPTCEVFSNGILEIALGRYRRAQPQDTLAHVSIGSACRLSELADLKSSTLELAGSHQLLRGLSLRVHVAEHLGEGIVQLSRDPLTLRCDRERLNSAV